MVCRSSCVRSWCIATALTEQGSARRGPAKVSVRVRVRVRVTVTVTVRG